MFKWILSYFNWKPSNRISLYQIKLRKEFQWVSSQSALQLGTSFPILGASVERYSIKSTSAKVFAGLADKLQNYFTISDRVCWIVRSVENGWQKWRYSPYVLSGNLGNKKNLRALHLPQIPNKLLGIVDIWALKSPRYLWIRDARPHLRQETSTSANEQCIHGLCMHHWDSDWGSHSKQWLPEGNTCKLPAT